ncbi:MAG: hypothetical protein LBN02_01460 [Oscillospiraceae bacterium]|jgi:Ser/Thr protein kinase RdoA (MazF antagonist)|nr:hypothetical protein [Oscillospiraceae bacterium]
MLSEIRDALNLFDISDAISAVKYIFNEVFPTRIKIIAKVSFESRLPLIVKLSHEREHTRQAIEEQSALSECLRSFGIRTARRYRSRGAYCAVVEGFGLSLHTTVEDYIGEEIAVITAELAAKIGVLLAQMHNISARNDLHINAATLFNAAGENDVSGYATFVELHNGGKLDNALAEYIISRYTERLERIRAAWAHLPTFAVQGDISVNNLTWIDGELGVFDYNNGGDEVLVSDMVLEGLLTAHEMDLADGLTDADRPALFTAFVDAYTRERPLSQTEIAVLNDVYAVAESMWFSKIVHADDSLEKLVERGENDRATSVLRAVADILDAERFA